MVVTQKGGGSAGKGPTLQEMREDAKRLAFASLHRNSQAPRVTGVAEKEISDYITSLDGVKKDRTDRITGTQESMAGESTGRRLILQGEVRRLEHTISLLDVEMSLLRTASDVVEKMEGRIKADMEFVGDNVAQKALCNGEAQTLCAKVIRLTKWLSQRKEMPNKEDKDIIGEIAYLKSYLGVRTAEM